MNQILLCSLAAFLLSVHMVAGVCDVHTDGCSTPLHMDLFYRDLFTPSCNKHDYCYRCGALYGLTKADCDSAFLSNMQAACATSGRRRELLRRRYNKRSVCTTFAESVYYEGVHVFGGLFFHEAGTTESYCGEPGISACLQ